MNGEHSIADIGRKMNDLGIWKRVATCNWGLKPRGTVLPYFCSVLLGDEQPVRARLLLLEGWQTMHEYVHVRADRNFGFYSTPMEMPHYELVVLASGESRLFRHDTGYLPQEATPEQAAFAAKMLWECFGVMLRLESDPQLPMRFSDARAIFARAEGADGTWTDVPLEIPSWRPQVESVSFPKELVKRAADLPLAAQEALDLDFRLLPNVMTREARPRSVYGLIAVDAATGEKRIDARVSVHPEAGLKGLWESMPRQVMTEFVRLGRVPGELRVCSGRVFRLLRPMCLELPFKLSLHDTLRGLQTIS